MNSIQTAKEIVESIPEEALDLAKQFWPGPLTMVLKKKSFVPDLVTSGLDSVAIRIQDTCSKTIISTIGFSSGRT